MSKVIVERPRRGGGKSKGRAKARALDGPASEGIRRPHRRRKGLNENLAPLHRFIEARIGRHWDKVYAEISEHLRPSSTVQQHVRDHVADIIAMKTSIRDGRVFVHRGRFRGGPEPLEESGYAFYVHPVSGVVLRNRRHKTLTKRWRAVRAADAAAIAARRVDLGPMRQLHKLKGIWFEVALELVAAQSAPGVPAPRDAIRDAGLSTLAPAELYSFRNVRAASKRQLGRKELLAYGLGNDQPED